MNNKMVIFGCGKLGHEAILVLGSENIECFCDNNPGLSGEVRYGKPIISFNELKEHYKDAFILICADNRRGNAYAIAKQCEENGIYDYMLYEPLKAEAFFSNKNDLLNFLDNPVNRLQMKNEIYFKKTIELHRQIDYLKKHSDIRHLKPAEGRLRTRQLDIVRVAAEFLGRISKLNIKPFLCCGNLIGYVRHNGFIPWDDDIDFAVIRDEYERLKEYCSLHMYSEDEFYNKRKTDKNITEDLKNFYWSNNGGDEFNIYKPAQDGSKIVLDFFVLDYYSEDYSFDELMKLAEKVREKLNEIMFDNEKRIECFQNLLKENQHNTATDSSNIYFGIDNMEIMHKYHRGQWIPKEVVYPLKKVLFEGEYFWVPNDAEEFLKYEYENMWEFPDDVGISQHEYQA